MKIVQKVTRNMPLFLYSTWSNFEVIYKYFEPEVS